MSENGVITWTNERRRLRDLVPWEHNPREINKREAERLGESLQEFGQIQTIAIDPEGNILDGHQRKLVWSVLPSFGPDYEVDVRVSSRMLTERERQKLVVFLHRGAVGNWDWDELANSFEVGDLLEWGFDEGELVGWGALEPGPEPEQEQAEARSTLAERFLVPPFSVLDARQGYWQERKRAWIALGIQSELGRGETAIPSGSLRPAASLGPDGRTVRGDGRGRPVAQRESSDQNGNAQRSDAAQTKIRQRGGRARCFGQDLMRGEHTVDE